MASRHTLVAGSECGSCRWVLQESCSMKASQFWLLAPRRPLLVLPRRP
jgi:hypothetical protein